MSEVAPDGRCGAVDDSNCRAAEPRCLLLKHSVVLALSGVIK